MQANAKVASFPPVPTTANDFSTLHLPLEESKSELMTPLGYMALSLTKAYCYVLIPKISNSHYYPDFNELQLIHILLGVGENLYYILLSIPLIHSMFGYAAPPWQP